MLLLSDNINEANFQLYLEVMEGRHQTTHNCVSNTALGCEYPLVQLGNSACEQRRAFTCPDSRAILSKADLTYSKINMVAKW